MSVRRVGREVIVVEVGEGVAVGEVSTLLDGIWTSGMFSVA